MLTAVGEIVDFMLYPYGNAKETQGSDGTWKFTCQHGKSECQANMYQACGIHQKNATKDWWPMIICMEKARNPATAAQDCATSAGMDWSQIKDCAGVLPAQGSKDIGNPLMHSIAQATTNLSPPHQWTPWIVMDGKPLSSSQLDKDLKKLVCYAYTGTKPAGCSATSEKLVFPEDGF